VRILKIISYILTLLKICGKNCKEGLNNLIRLGYFKYKRLFYSKLDKPSYLTKARQLWDALRFVIVVSRCICAKCECDVNRNYKVI